MGASTGSLARKVDTTKSRKTHSVKKLIGLILFPNDTMFLTAMRFLSLSLGIWAHSVKQVQAAILIVTKEWAGRGHASQMASESGGYRLLHSSEWSLSVEAEKVTG